MTGVTTRQMLDAPRDAVYVWPVARSLSYAISLARYLGRTDLMVMASVEVLRPERVYEGNRPVVIDHMVDHWRNREAIHTLRARGLLHPSQY